METPYQFHSRALQLLEKRKLLVVVSTNYQINYRGPKYQRQKMAFPKHVGTYKDDPDWDNRLMIKYCNNWLLKFEQENEENAKSVKRKEKENMKHLSEIHGEILMQLNLVKQRENFFSE